MPALNSPTLHGRPIVDWLRRLAHRWWRRQSPAHQDRYATLGPLVSVLLFLFAIILAFWYLRNEEFDREQESVKRDTEIAQQQIRLRLIENQEHLVRIAREIATKATDAEEFVNQAVSFTRERPEVTTLIWVNASGQSRAHHAITNFHPENGITGGEIGPSLPLQPANPEPA